MEPRIGDAEREVAGARLGDHYAAGRLEHEEYDERLDAVFSARTRADLDQLFWDLPRAAAVAPPRQAPTSRPGMPRWVPMAVIAILVIVAVIKAAPWVLLIAAAWFVFLRPRRRHSPGHGHGISPGSCATALRAR